MTARTGHILLSLDGVNINDTELAYWSVFEDGIINSHWLTVSFAFENCITLLLSPFLFLSIANSLTLRKPKKVIIYIVLNRTASKCDEATELYTLRICLSTLIVIGILVSFVGRNQRKPNNIFCMMNARVGSRTLFILRKKWNAGQVKIDGWIWTIL